MGFLAWIGVGLVAGLLAKMIVPGKDPGGWILTILIGIAGAFIGGWIGTRLGWGDLTGFDLRSIGLAVLGSILLLLALKIVFRKG